MSVRMWTATVVCRLTDGGEPDYSVDVEVEDGVPQAIIDTIPTAVENIGRSMQRSLDAGEARITVRE